MNASSARHGYLDPIRAGVALGVILFGSLAVAGRGLGASGAFAVGAAAAAHAVAPAYASSHPYIASWIPLGSDGLFGEWIVVELVAVAFGAWLSARWAGRLHRSLNLVTARSSRTRVTQALVGGALMGGGARLAHGCTSGLGLTGGALLATGAWLFIPVAFATAFGVAWLMRRGTA